MASRAPRAAGQARRTQRPGGHDLHDHPLDHLRRSLDFPGPHGHRRILSAGDEADFLVAFYQHSYEDHIDFLKQGGVLLYDSDNVQPNLDDKRFVYVGIPITGLTVEALGGTAKDKGKNIFILGLLARYSTSMSRSSRAVRKNSAARDESIAETPR